MKLTDEKVSKALVKKYGLGFFKKLTPRGAYWHGSTLYIFDDETGFAKMGGIFSFEPTKKLSHVLWVLEALEVDYDLSKFQGHVPTKTKGLGYGAFISAKSTKSKPWPKQSGWFHDFETAPLALCAALSAYLKEHP